MKALIVGSSGQVGAALLASLQAHDVPAVGTFHSHPLPGGIALDIRDRESVRRRFAETAPDIAFLTQNTPGGVDFCEKNPSEADAVLVQGTRNILDAAASLDVKVVFISSDYVFDGASGPYSEQDPPRPISVYGRAKLAAEELVLAHASGYLIIRTTAVFSWMPGTKNFAMQIWEKLRHGQTIMVPNDQWCNPTLADYLAEACIALAQAGDNGIYNVVGRDWMTRESMAGALARTMALDPALIRPVATSELRQLAARPLKGGLKTDRLSAALGSAPPDMTQSLARFTEKFHASAGTTGAHHV